MIFLRILFWEEEKKRKKKGCTVFSSVKNTYIWTNALWWTGSFKEENPKKEKWIIKKKLKIQIASL